VFITPRIINHQINHTNQNTLFMKKILILSATFILSGSMFAQKITFDEYKLSNGMHVILHHDSTVPLVVTSVMYHVGAKDEAPDRTGFAHFFEHLLFEGTANIKRGEWMKTVSANGGVNNANTTEDRTYYYEIFPSNNLELGLWMESERLMHPVINQIGVKTQNEVVKEEKRLRIDNKPYGNLVTQVKKNLFEKHPYHWVTIGDMAHLDAAKLEEFQAFNKKFYIPNNAVLVVAGDLGNITKTKEWIQQYFGSIPKGADIVRTSIAESPITETKKAKYEDPNIQLPMTILAYRTPSMKSRDARILDMISTILSNGKSSRLYKKIVDDKKMALELGTFNYSQEDYGSYIIYAIPQGNNSAQMLVKEVDEEITKLQSQLLTDKEMQKLLNIYENNFVNKNSSMEGIADHLASYYMLYKDVNLINTEIDIYRSITAQEIQDMAKKYLKPNQRLELDYVPAKTAPDNKLTH
jgi:zinc protease